MLKEKLKIYFFEGDKHIEKIKNAKNILIKHYPFTIDTFEELNEVEKDKLDVLAFRFAKLQDLIGDKIFRNILNLMGFNTQKPFIEILSELEREGFINTPKWIALRNARNSISHEYPYQEEKLIEAINYILENCDYLIEVFQKLKAFYETLKERN